MNLHQNSVKTPIVKMTFEHLSDSVTQSVESSQHICVFWDFEEENWSNSGCEMLKTNLTHSTCACDHLTHFAVLTHVEDPVVGNGLDFGFISANSESKQDQRDGNTVITLEIATYLVSSVCLLILVIILVQVSLKQNNYSLDFYALSSFLSYYSMSMVFM